MTSARPHLLHVAAGRAHLHFARDEAVTGTDLRAAGRAARAFLGDERLVPSGIADGFYPFGIDVNGNAVVGSRIRDEATP
jgi:hypothetical protein